MIRHLSCSISGSKSVKARSSPRTERSVFSIIARLLLTLSLLGVVSVGNPPVAGAHNSGCGPITGPAPVNNCFIDCNAGVYFIVTASTPGGVPVTAGGRCADGVAKCLPVDNDPVGECSMPSSITTYHDDDTGFCFATTPAGVGNVTVACAVVGTGGGVPAAGTTGLAILSISLLLIGAYFIRKRSRLSSSFAVSP